MKVALVLLIMISGISSWADVHEELIEQDIDNQGNAYEVIRIKNVKKDPKSKIKEVKNSDLEESAEDKIED